MHHKAEAVIKDKHSSHFHTSGQNPKMNNAILDLKDTMHKYKGELYMKGKKAFTYDYAA